MLETGKDTGPAEAVWQAWIRKNKAQDRFRFERRLKVISFLGVFVVVGVLLRRFTG